MKLDELSYLGEYFTKIESGEILTSSKVYESYKKQIESLETGKYYFDVDKALRPIQFTERYCKHAKDEFAGKPFILSLWQKARDCVIYGIQDSEKHVRKIKEVFLVVGSKNGKTTDAGAKALFHLMADGKKGAEVYCVATKRQQANKTFDASLDIVLQSNILLKRLHKTRTDLEYVTHNIKSIYRALSSDSGTLNGLIPTLIIADEFHAWKKRNLYNVLVARFGSASEPLFYIITTTGGIRESVFDDRYKYSEMWLTGAIEDDGFLPLIYELDNEKEMHDEKCWIKPNPNLGICKSIDTMRRDYKKALVIDSDKVSFLLEHCNVITTGVGGWLNLQDIKKIKVQPMDEVFRSSFPTLGVDMSQTNDLTNVTFEVCIDGTVYLHQMFFMASEQMKKKIEEDGVPYDIWKEQGYLIVHEGYAINQIKVGEYISAEVERLDLALTRIGCDPAYASILRNYLMMNIYDTEAIRQGYITLSEPMKDIETKVEAGKIVTDNPIMIWNLTNVQVRRDEVGNIKPDKKSRKQRIDGVSGTLCSHVMYLRYTLELDSNNERR